MAKKRKLPRAEDVSIVYVYPGAFGFRYTCRGWDNKPIYDSPRFFKSRYKARDEILSYWPGVRVSFEVI